LTKVRKDLLRSFKDDRIQPQLLSQTFTLNFAVFAASLQIENDRNFSAGQEPEKCCDGDFLLDPDRSPCVLRSAWLRSRGIHYRNEARGNLEGLEDAGD
jgi:hypothetical protein